jgi:hypothetical protein
MRSPVSWSGSASVHGAIDSLYMVLNGEFYTLVRMRAILPNAGGMRHNNL